MAGLSVSVSAQASVEGPFTVVSLTGEADASCRELAPALAALAAERPALLIVDLSGLRFIDSWALHTVLRTARDLRKAGSAVALAGPQAPVARILELAGADRVFPVHRSVQEAVGR
jgi:anti-sigma B factor antagonist